MSNANVSLHDAQGRHIVYTGAEPAWRLEAADARAEQIAARILASSDDRSRAMRVDGEIVQPVRVGGEVVGAIVVSNPGALTGERQASDHAQLGEIVRRLGSAVNELFEADIELARRNAELDMLFRLSSMLVSAKDVASALDAALSAAADLMAFEAGAIHLVEDDGAALRLRASLGLSDRDRAQMETLESRGDGKFASPALLTGFAGSIACDMSFNGRRVGVMRLFLRSAEELAPTEQALLKTVADQVGAAVASARLIESERIGRQVQRQMRLAADVQRRMLPSASPSIAGLDVAARYLPSLDLGGDFYDLIDLGGHLAIAVGDVAGKGAPAAMLMAAVRATLRAHATEVYHLDEIIRRVNEAMTRDTLPNEFATLFYGVINPKTLRLTYCSAGHDPTYLLRSPASGSPTTADLHALDVGGTVIGIDAMQKYERGTFDLQAGDTLVAYTDGVVDARNFEQQRFGRDRLRQAIVDAVVNEPACSAQRVADHIVWEVRRFVGLNPATDDITVVAMRVGERH